MKRRETREQLEDAIFCVIDEAEYLLEAEPDTVRLIRRLVGTGRAVNIHVITVSNNPTAQSLGDMNIKRNSLGRVVGVVDSPDAARVATGIPDSGANKLLGKGDMLHLSPGSINRISVPEAKDGLLADIPHSENPILDNVVTESYPSVAPRPVGRPVDPPDLKTVARLMMYLDKCQTNGTKPLSAASLGRGMKPTMWGSGKVERHMVMARDVLGELQARSWRGL
jgi:DNA segregation ATPase FtsK/SpoIIIE-like protein